MTDIDEGYRTLHVQRSTSTAHRLTHYDGVCGNIHGHNMEWDVDVDVTMDDAGDANMPLDLKEVADAIDDVDHAIVLSTEDPIYSEHDLDAAEEILGDIIWLEDGDPTCEVLAKWMAKRIHGLDPAVDHVRVEVAETDKYAISTHYGANLERE